MKHPKHSYIEDDDNKNDSSENKDPNQDNDGDQQDKRERSGPGLKKGYNEKNPSQPQGSFTPDSQGDSNKEKSQGDETK
jgi:hypothetical protein